MRHLEVRADAVSAFSAPSAPPSSLFAQTEFSKRTTQKKQDMLTRSKDTGDKREVDRKCI
jgi:hypothetical protein